MTGTTDYKLITEESANGSEKHKLATQVFEDRILVRVPYPRLLFLLLNLITGRENECSTF